MQGIFTKFNASLRFKNLSNATQKNDEVRKAYE